MVYWKQTEGGVIMERFEKIAIMGTGSLGTILGAYISKAGRSIDLIDVKELHWIDSLFYTLYTWWLRMKK